MNKKKPIIIISAIVICIITIIAICPPHTPSIIVTAENGETPTINVKPNLNVFLENSGSMNGYMIAGSQLKDALYDYVSDLSGVCDNLGLYYINTAIIPRPNNLDNYIKNLTPASFATAGGNHSNTDIGQIVTEVINKTENSDVSLLISDFILDLPSKDADKFLGHKSIQIKNALKNKIKDNPNFATVIIRMESLFAGKYFYPNGTVENLDNVKRPYYIWMFGDKCNIAFLFREVPISGIKHGYEEYAAYTNESSVPYMVSNIGMTGNTIKAKKGQYEIMVRADFSSTLQPQDVITMPVNYKLSSTGTEISSISQIKSEDESYTDYLIVSMDSKSVSDKEIIKFVPPLIPDWITRYNDETADSIMNNLQKTTGIKALVQGVADAYRNQSISTQFNIEITKRK